MANVKLNNKKSDEDLTKLSQEELINRIQCLEAHNSQLRNILAKTNEISICNRKKQKPFDFSK